MIARTDPTRWRPAAHDDSHRLRDLEREANLVALADVFPPAEHPFPDEGVLARWQQLLAEPDAITEVVDDPTGGAGSTGREAPLLAFVARDGRVVRHLAVAPRAWGRGLGSEAVRRASAAIRATGETPHLWCLERNQRAWTLYGRLGWRTTGRSRRTPWPPYPVELELCLVVV